MHKEILNQNQVELLNLITDFKREFYLAGGTAIALYIGHRRSIDFDLFKSNKLHTSKIITKIKSHNIQFIITRNVSEQLNMIISDVKFTFFEYPHPIDSKIKFENYIKLPTLLDLAAMKAFALGRRSKWKDYVDLYFIIKNYYSIKEISERATSIFEQQFSEKLFRAQLIYFKDIDYTEAVEYLVEPVDEEEIKNFLINKAIQLN